MFYDVTHANLFDPGERVNLHFQLFDVYALQKRFGANISWNTGNDTYTAESFDGNRQVLWDAGGNDTLDFGAQTVNQIIDLNGGAFSTLGGFFPPTENLSIAYGAVIENAIGGTGSDNIRGNSARNSLSGRTGNDTLDGAAGDDTLDGSVGNDRLIGGAGNDSLVGGRGSDALFGGAGADKADYTKATAGVTANLATSRGSAGDAAGDTYFSIEILSGSNFGDTLIGGSFVDDLRGRGGSDLLSGLTANDILVGASGNDTLIGGTGNDTMSGGRHKDRFDFAPGFGADTITDFRGGAGVYDVIRLFGLGPSFDTFTEVLNATAQIGSNAVIDFGGGNTITLLGVDKSVITDDDFLFG